MRRRGFIAALAGTGTATLSGCTGTSGNEGSSQSNGGSSGAESETIELRVGSFLKKDSFAASKFVFPVWVEKVNNKLEGYELDAQFLGSGSVGGPGELFSLTADGTVDIALDLPAYQRGKMPLSTIGTVANSFPPTTAGHSSACQALHEMTTPGGDSTILYEEFSNLGVRPIMVYTTPPSQLHTKEKITDVEQLKGVPVPAGGAQADVANALGMAPAQIPAGDIATALQSGTVDAQIVPMAATDSNGWYGTLNYCTTNLNLGGTTVSWVINPDFLDGFSPEVKEAMLEAGSETVAEYASAIEQGTQELISSSEHIATEAPIDKDTQYQLYETETADTIDNRLASVAETWVNKRDDSAAAQEAIETYQSLQKKYRE